MICKRGIHSDLAFTPFSLNSLSFGIQTENCFRKEIQQICVLLSKTHGTETKKDLMQGLFILVGLSKETVHASLQLTQFYANESHTDFVSSELQITQYR